MRMQTLGQGWVMRTAGKAGSLAVGPRLAVLPDGEVLCSCMVQEALGRNDFVPVLHRSRDGGKTWSEQGPVWPAAQSRWSIFANVSAAPSGWLMLFGSRTPIDQPGESFWSDATQGLKQNELFWATSADAGRTWTGPNPIPMPIPGSAEAPGALKVLRGGRWIAPYSPYNTFDPACRVERGQAVVVFSDDQGKTWRHSSMLRYDEPDSGSAEVWVAELADGRLLGAGWHIDLANKTEYPNAYALSHDGGQTWSPMRTTGIMGQSTCLLSLRDGRAIFLYNQRKHGTVGVWLAVVRPTDNDFGIQFNGVLWQAQTPTQSQSSGEHAEWTDFSFGEPCIAELTDGTFLAVLWCSQPDGRGVYWVRAALSD